MKTRNSREIEHYKMYFYNRTSILWRWFSDILIRSRLKFALSKKFSKLLRKKLRLNPVLTKLVKTQDSYPWLERMQSKLVATGLGNERNLLNIWSAYITFKKLHSKLYVHEHNTLIIFFVGVNKVYFTSFLSTIFLCVCFIRDLSYR